MKCVHHGMNLPQRQHGVLLVKEVKHCSVGFLLGWVTNTNIPVIMIFLPFPGRYQWQQKSQFCVMPFLLFINSLFISFRYLSIFICSTVLIIAKRLVRILLTSPFRFSSRQFIYGLNHSKIKLLTNYVILKSSFSALEYGCIKWTPLRNGVRYLYNYFYTKKRSCENLFNEIISAVKHWVLSSEMRGKNEKHPNKNQN